MIAAEQLLRESAAAGTHLAIYPCSQAQQRFWFEEALHPRNPGLNVAVRWQLIGELSDAHLDAAWRLLVARHPSLRTSFDELDGEPAQIVAPRVEFGVRVIDLRHLDEPQRLAEAARLARREAQATFDITVAPLIRATRLVIDHRTSTLLVTAHHTVCDGWSVGVLARDMGEICAALQSGAAPALPQLPISYSDYATWEQGYIRAPGVLEAEADYARTLLRGYQQFELLPDFPRPAVQSANGAIASLLLDRKLTDGLAAIARTNGCTLFVAALSALFTLLHRYTGETDITLGTQVAGRDDEDLENVVGCFINTIALRADLAGDPPFSEMLARISDGVSDAFEMRHVPLERLIQAVRPKRDLSRNALFSVNFIFQRSFITNATYGDFALVDLPSSSAGALYDLNIFMVERPEGWRAACEYNTDLFAPETIDGLLTRFCNVLRAVVSDAAQPLSRIAVLSAADRTSLVVDANRTKADYPANETVTQIFAAQVARSPHAPALVCGDQTLTYAELDAAANRLAHELLLRGVERGTRVGVLLERSPQLVIALLAVLKTGAAYVPLDPAYPRERLAYIMGNAKLTTVVTHSALTDRLTSAHSFIAVDAEAALIARHSDAALAEAVRSEDVAYVIYTSGSTGRPKGVAVGHRALMNLLWAMRERPGITASDTLVAVTTVSFDIAGLELFLPLIAGAELVIAVESDSLDGAALLRVLQGSRATIMQATPVTWQLLIDAGWRGEPRLKMLCGGEALPRVLAQQLLERSPELWNMYGPTETTIWSAAVRVTPDFGPVLIGPPIANTQFYVLDPNGALVPPGAPGELHIGGDGIALGYFERDELTRERFVPDLFGPIANAKMYRTGDIVRARAGGCFEFLGRTDHQIKLRGLRIEPGEIEAALLREPGVAEAVVVAGADAAGVQSLRAYVVAKAGLAVTGAWSLTLRTALAATLPAYMLPAPIVVLPALPRTPNGKIDRAALPAVVLEAGGESADPPATHVEIALARIICGLIEREQIGRHDDMFALGFHSLLAVRLIAQIVQQFGVKLPLRALFDNPTVAALAGRIGAAPVAPPPVAVDQAIAAIHPNGARTPFVFFHNDLWAAGLYCRRLAAITGPAQPFFAIAPHGTNGLPVLTSIEAMATDYLARLRTIQPHGPYRIGGFCAGGLVAYEVARQLQARGETVEQLILLNTSAPAPRATFFGDAILRAIGLDARLKPDIRERLCWNVVRLFDAIGHGPKTTLRFLARRVRATLARSSGTANDRLNEPYFVEKRRGAAETENYFANLIAAYTYHPKPCDGDLILIWGSDQPATSDDTTTGWAGLARNVTVVPVRGDHSSPIREGVELVAKVIDAILQRPDTTPAARTAAAGDAARPTFDVSTRANDCRSAQKGTA
jgi:amino acid adenylation domain-containing protein